MTAHVNIAMDEAVKAKLEAFAVSRGRGQGELLLEAAERIAQEHDALAIAIDEARASLDAGIVFTHEEVVAAVMARRQERMRQP